MKIELKGVETMEDGKIAELQRLIGRKARKQGVREDKDVMEALLRNHDLLYFLSACQTQTDLNSMCEDSRSHPSEHHRWKGKALSC